MQFDPFTRDQGRGRETQMLTLHLLEFAIVACEQGEDPLRLSVTVYIQLEVGQHGAVKESQ